VVARRFRSRRNRTAQVTSEAHRPTRASANDPPQANPGGLVQLVFLVVWRKESEGDWRIAREFLSAEASTDQS